MSTLITMGCSFSEGVGCYDIELFNQYGDINNEEFERLNGPNKLKGCIGTNIQNKLGYSTFYNLAHGASSNDSQFLKFFHYISKFDKLDDVVVLWQITFYTRKGTIHQNRFADYPYQKNNWVGDYYSEMISSWDGVIGGIDDDDRLLTAIRINAIKEFCKNRGWKFYTWFWESHEFRKVLDMYPQLSDCIIPFNKPPMEEDDTYESITSDNHPNEIGYSKITTELIKAIDVFLPDFPKPNEPILKQINLTSIEL